MKPSHRPPVEVAAAYLLEGDEARIVEPRQMVGGHRVLKADLPSEFGDGEVAAADHAQQFDPCRMGQRTTKDHDITFHTYKTR